MIKVGKYKIGQGHPCFIAAEIGLNHNGDINLAKKTIDSAKEAGVDAVKFQNYETEDFITDKSLMYEYTSNGKQVGESQFDMFKRCELSESDLRDLKDYCENNYIVFFSTPTSAAGVDLLKKINSPLLKNGSDYLQNLPLIEEMAKSGIPTVISTGMADVSEIEDAVQAFEGSGGKQLLILHCTSSYPTPSGEVNLRKIETLKRKFKHPIGFSDHTEGTLAAVGAVVLGACFLEKHFTLDKNLEGPDHRFSSDPEEMKSLVTAIRRIELNMGSSKLDPTSSESYGRENFRLSCVASTNLPKGHVIEEGDVVFNRPGTGLPPKMADSLLKRELRVDIKSGDIIELNSLI